MEHKAEKRTVAGGNPLFTIALRWVPTAYILLLVLFPQMGCGAKPRDTSAITLTVIDQAWPDSNEQFKQELAEFTRETGIRVQIMPAPESAVEQLATWRRLLESGAEVPDVYAVDIIWPGVLADGLVDLKAYVPAEEVSAHFPQLIADYNVNGKLVALPHNMNAGLLFYRTDLLKKYGYTKPPRTWDELETQSKRIQAGERATGHKDFWGFVWQGAPSEALTCNALEWQVSEGGGTILDENGRVTVNNPRTIRAWSRAARWVGSISPTGVTAYKEWDAFNIWQSGNAAFMRNWTNAYVAARTEDSTIRDRFDIGPLPRGKAGIGATLGGNGYGVSRHSRHPREAVMLVRFLASRDEQVRRCLKTAQPPTIPAVYENAQVLAANPYFARILALRNELDSRPSVQAGRKYPEVSRTYFEAVHMVISTRQTAAQAVSNLQQQLLAILNTSAATADTTGP